MYTLPKSSAEASTRGCVVKMLEKLFASPKYLLVLVNILFVITGVILVNLGLWMQSTFSDYPMLLPDLVDSMPAFAIGTGVVIFVFAVAGVYGAFTNSYMIKVVFALTMVFMLIVEIAGCIAGFALQDRARHLVHHQLRKSSSLYGQNFRLTKQWDLVQQNFHCCGVVNSIDWLSILNTQDSLGLPVSCCSHVYGVVHMFECTVPTAYIRGCWDEFGNFVSTQVWTIGVVGVVLSFIQVWAVVGALWVVKIARVEKERYWDNKSGRY